MIGIYGGTFDPIHMGHLRAAEEVAAELDLSRILFIPSARPPHKDGDESPVAPAKERLAWVELAVAGNPLFLADSIEVERPGPSYLIDTLESLGHRFPDEELVFVVGRDAFCEMGTWRAPERLFATCHIAVTTRPPVAGGRIAEWLPECVHQDFQMAADGLSGHHRSANTWIRQLEITALDVSATDIRSRLARGASILDLVPEAAHRAIMASGCYNGPHADPVPGAN